MRTSIVQQQLGIPALLPTQLATGLLRRGLDQLLGRLDGGRLTLVDHTGASTSYGSAPGSGSGLTAEVIVRSPRCYRAALFGGTVGIAQSYLRGEWDTDDLVALFRMFARDSASTDRMEGGLSVARTLALRLRHRLRANTLAGSRKNIAAHYDLSNEFFATFLDPTMTYSSGIFERADSTLEQASLAKIDRLCDKLRLQPSDHLLEIGTGWGALAIRAAQKYGCRVTTTTLSEQQAALARERIMAAGLSDRITVLTRDYRELTGTYDKLVSVEMIEAVGHQHLPQFFRSCGELLAPHGLMALQAITVRDQRYQIGRKQVDVIQALLFPGSDIPSVNAMLAANAAGSKLGMVHLEDITPHYARTVRQWRERFDANLNRVRELGTDESFHRLWRYYLSYCEAGFAERHIGCAQLLFAPPHSRVQPLLPSLAKLS